MSKVVFIPSSEIDKCKEEQFIKNEHIQFYDREFPRYILNADGEIDFVPNDY